MPRAILEEIRCRPSACPQGLCLARPSCPVKAIWQEEPNEMPYLSGGLCNGCGKCLKACPLRAISMN